MGGLKSDVALAKLSRHTCENKSQLGSIRKVIRLLEQFSYLRFPTWIVDRHDQQSFASFHKDFVQECCLAQQAFPIQPSFDQLKELLLQPVPVRQVTKIENGGLIRNRIRASSSPANRRAGVTA